ncbi:coproporphyrinogen III oxidase [Toxoplasma gondii ME49]|uniref:coproporphyrinogen oxidase n=2 Tax=Toxoplasma gondii TaxID=5811 RepID=S8GU38_TOXGM|nr:coproporphyrinogen III oxidase [Toxoplasma gondii ME49]EPT32109.1 coproporphyrinogen III oxidase [Toxoplasma gondii ME49]KYF42520.1 coproporphyrinogen III oxidase [Toxoplasma gondii ARI]|eukprot:XP_018638332.1 coproporphyrinogen III oxidase [Toxoplasma gondii ME49]
MDSQKKQVYHPDKAFRERWEAMLRRYQTAICDALASVDGGSFCEDMWTRGRSGGGGCSRVLQDSTVLEKGGVNVSAVHGTLPPDAVTKMTCHGHHDLPAADGEGLQFYAAGLSMVIHPRNPMAPTVHLNYRFFQIFRRAPSERSGTDECGGEEATAGESLLWWFGGGADLSPSYVFEEDCVFFHEKLREQCDRCDPLYYARFKRWCDAYFRNHHRNEGRGIGGIFFDDLNENMTVSPEKFFAFAEDGLQTFIDAYIPILIKRKDQPFTESQKIWQQIRRGRYVEFNLVHDRGTKFGFQVPGSRIESILISLPLTARWEYQFKIEKGSKEEEAQRVFVEPRDWLPIDNAHLEGFSWPTETGARRC